MSAPEVLVLDDDEPTRKLLVAVLRDAGLDARASSDVSKPDATPHVVLVDLPMPKAGGPGAVQALRRRYPRSRIVAMSARFDLGRGDGQSVARQLGADRVAAKPLDVHSLVATLRGLLHGKPSWR